MSTYCNFTVYKYGYSLTDTHSSKHSVMLQLFMVIFVFYCVTKTMFSYTFGCALVEAFKVG